MPDELPKRIRDRWIDAIASVDDFIVRVAGKRLPYRVVKRYSKHNFRLGWQVRVNFSDTDYRELHILVDGGFPYTAPRVAVANAPNLLTWPHLEQDGLLCILPTDTAVSGDNPAEVVKYVLGKACRLIKESISGSNVEDFRLEFLSYWMLAADQGATNFISILEPQGPSREIAVWHGNSVQIVGENPEALERWLLRRGANPGKGQKYKFYKGVLLWLPEPLLPDDYPQTAADVRALARDWSLAATEVLEELAAASAERIDVLFGASTANGACFGAMTVRSPHSKVIRRGKRNTLGDGFRPGHVPEALSVNRYLSRGVKVTKTIVERADHFRIHGRDYDPHQKRLRTLQVAVLGCGSVGGPLARLLGQAGIGNLLLVDCGTMDWPNVGRHVLGASSVDHYKASELAHEIKQLYPHLNDISYRNSMVGPDATDLMEELTTCDLIVSTMGNWAAESFLNDVHREWEHFPTVLYGWVEPNAAAAHAVLIPQGKACLRCGVNDTGRPYLTVTKLGQ